VISIFGQEPRESSNESEATAEGSTETTCDIVNIETLRRNRQLTYVREWLAAQLPWQRGVSQKVAKRIRAA
jgi:hypothetical protein